MEEHKKYSFNQKMSNSTKIKLNLNLKKHQIHKLGASQAQLCIQLEQHKYSTSVETYQLNY